MPNTNFTFALSTGLLFLLGCANAHGPDAPLGPDPVDPTIDIGVPRHVITVPPPMPGVASLGECLAEGGRLLEVDAVNNNDSADHGALITLAVDASNRIAAAGMD